MGRLRAAAIRASLETFYFTGAHHIARPFLGGLGAIFTMHRVCEPTRDKFHPNRILEISADFLELAITQLKRAKIDIIDLDEAVERMTQPKGKNRFVVLTFDDGYVDNYTAAWHVLRRMKVPFTIYIPTAFPDAQGNLWWIALEQIIAQHPALLIEMKGERRFFETARPVDKRHVFNVLHGWLRAMPNDEQQKTVYGLAERYGIDLSALCRGLMMNWQQIGDMATDPRVTIGAHSVDHFALSRLSEKDARWQMRESANVIASVIGKRPRHFSFPYGWEDAAGPREFELARSEGFTTAVTTRPGVLFHGHANHLTALPRISLNGDFQALRYLDVLLSGLPSYVYNGFERYNIA